jgi:acetolactate synthase-1/2/3 large subunit
MNRKPDLAIMGDPSTFLLKLTSAIQFDPFRFESWMNILKQLEADREKKIHDCMQVKTDYINPLHLCAKIDDAITSDSVVIGDGGDFIATASYIVRPRGPLSWMDPGPYGTLGVGAGFAIAAKLVQREADVWLLYGDGAAGYGLMELDTFVRHDLPIIAVIGNDAGWTQISRDQTAILHDDVATVLKYSDYHKIADALDAEGVLLENPADIDEVLHKAKIASHQGKPVLINALIGKTDFRKGSISV